jgi:hypothetical protein
VEDAAGSGGAADGGAARGAPDGSALPVAARDAGALVPDAGGPVPSVQLVSGRSACDGTCPPSFEVSVSRLTAALQQEMTGRSWKADLACPAFAELRLLRLSHWTFEGLVAEGELVVHESAAAELSQVFAALFAARFPIERMVRVDAYEGNDDASMAANNTSAFNCRMTTSGNALSQHSHGTAVDINPLRNPYVTSGGNVYPPAGAAYLDRAHVRPGMIVDGDPVVSAFDASGWAWGGRWASTKDYQHFSRSGR